jgi:hypothetical protein
MSVLQEIGIIVNIVNGLFFILLLMFLCLHKKILSKYINQIDKHKLIKNKYEGPEYLILLVDPFLLIYLFDSPPKKAVYYSFVEVVIKVKFIKKISRVFLICLFIMIVLSAGLIWSKIHSR